MGEPRLQTFRCTIHNVVFGAQSGVDVVLVRCPLCADAETKKLRAEVEKLTEHRDLLLRAIDLKLTIAPAPSTEG